MTKEDYSNIIKIVFIQTAIVLMALYFGFRHISNKEFNDLSKRCWKNTEGLKTTDGKPANSEFVLAIYNDCMDSGFTEKNWSKIQSIESDIESIKDKLNIN